MLAEMTSRELTHWQAFLMFRNERQRQDARDREFLGDDEQVTEW